jgi:hypothetical protein
MRSVRRVLVLALPFVAGIVGCGGARYVSEEPGGGIVAIPYHTNSWPTYYQDQAEKMMKAKCPKGYVIDMEGPVLIGQAAKEEASRNPANADLVLTSEWILQHPPAVEDTEWQIKFHTK